MNIIAIIPARGGSKGIPNKNIIDIVGKPLIYWTIEAAKKSCLIDRIVVSSDSPRILSVAKSCGAEIISRPKKYASDSAPAGLAVEHTLEYLEKKEKYSPDIVVLLQPTSPLRTSEDIDNAINLFMDEKAGALISIAEENNKYLKSFIIEKGILRGIIRDELVFTNRQELPKIYIPNGAIFIVKTDEFKKNKTLFSEKTIGYVMDKERSIDLDNLSDKLLIEDFLKGIHEKKNIIN